MRNLLPPEPLRHRAGRVLPCRHCKGLVQARVSRGKIVEVRCLQCAQAFTVTEQTAPLLLASRAQPQRVTRK